MALQRLGLCFGVCLCVLFFRIYAPLVVSVLATTSAQATVAVAIDLSRQSMHVDSRSGSYDWPISSARSGFYTPGGSYAPTHMEVMHYSHKYHMSPMPHAIFFRGGYAIHGTYATGALGSPASHGCVRLSPGNAAALYSMVKSEGARISISGAPPVSRSFYASRQDDGDMGAARRRARRATYAAYGYGDGETEGYGYVAPRRAPRYLGYAYQQPYAYAPQYYGGAPRPSLWTVFGE